MPRFREAGVMQFLKAYVTYLEVHYSIVHACDDSFYRRYFLLGHADKIVDAPGGCYLSWNARGTKSNDVLDGDQLRLSGKSIENLLPIVVSRVWYAACFLRNKSPPGGRSDCVFVVSLLDYAVFSPVLMGHGGRGRSFLNVGASLRSPRIVKNA